MKKLSIILPIYNVERYLQECIDSIICQTGFDECEMLLIDDGATDNSAAICDKNAAEHELITVHHKKNGGLSDARNYGLSKANGEYVLFFDSDDFMMPGVLQEILQSLEVCEDVLLMDAVTVDENGNPIENPEFEYRHIGLESGKVYSGEDAIKLQLNAGALQTTVWLGAYRREFLLENQLWFKRNLLHEDELWSPNTFLEASSIVYQAINYYAYRIRNNSIMRSEKKDNSKNIASLIYVYSHVTKLYDWKIADDELLTALKDDVSRRYLHCITVWRINEYPKLMKRVDRREIFRNSKSKKNKVRALILMMNAGLYVSISSKFASRG